MSTTVLPGPDHVQYCVHYGQKRREQQEERLQALTLGPPLGRESSERAVFALCLESLLEGETRTVTLPSLKPVSSPGWSIYPEELVQVHQKARKAASKKEGDGSSEE